MCISVTKADILNFTPKILTSANSTGPPFLRNFRPSRVYIR